MLPDTASTQTPISAASSQLEWCRGAILLLDGCRRRRHLARVQACRHSWHTPSLVLPRQESVRIEQAHRPGHARCKQVHNLPTGAHRRMPCMCLLKLFCASVAASHASEARALPGPAQLCRVLPGPGSFPRCGRAQTPLCRSSTQGRRQHRGRHKEGALSWRQQATQPGARCMGACVWDRAGQSICRQDHRTSPHMRAQHAVGCGATPTCGPAISSDRPAVKAGTLQVRCRGQSETMLAPLPSWPQHPCFPQLRCRQEALHSSHEPAAAAAAPLWAVQLAFLDGPLACPEKRLEPQL